MKYSYCGEPRKVIFFSGVALVGVGWALFSNFKMEGRVQKTLNQRQFVVGYFIINSSGRFIHPFIYSTSIH